MKDQCARFFSERVSIFYVLFPKSEDPFKKKTGKVFSTFVSFVHQRKVDFGTCLDFLTFWIQTSDRFKKNLDKRNIRDMHSPCVFSLANFQGGPAPRGPTKDTHLVLLAIYISPKRNSDFRTNSEGEDPFIEQALHAQKHPSQ